MADSEFFLGRQPIVGRSRELVAYELLFRSSTANAATIRNDLTASAAVIQYAFSELGMQSALEHKLGFINVPEALLMSGLIEMLPSEHVVLEILETVKITEEVVARCRQLKNAGYVLALDDVVDLTDAQKLLLPEVSLVKLDVLAMARPKLCETVQMLRAHDVTLVAEKVETAADHQFCQELGFELFQGYFFAKPVILSGRSIEPSTLALLKLLGLVIADAELEELEAAVKHSPGLTLRLLKLANSVAYAKPRKTSSVREAIIIVGRVQLGRLVQIMIFAQQSGVPVTSDPVLQTAAMRGRLMEGLAGLHGGQGLSEPAFIAGMLSMVEVLFGLPLIEIIGYLNLEKSLQAALLRREGELGTLLQLVEASEQEDGEAALALMQQMGLRDMDQLNRLQVEAMTWAGTI